MYPSQSLKFKSKLLSIDTKKRIVCIVPLSTVCILLVIEHVYKCAYNLGILLHGSTESI